MATRRPGFTGLVRSADAVDKSVTWGRLIEDKAGSGGWLNPETRYEKAVARRLEKLCPFGSVERFASRCWKPTTKRPYLSRLAGYLAWLKDEKRITLDTDPVD